MNKFVLLNLTMQKKEFELTETCRQRIQGVTDTQDLLSGKWKTSIIASLYFNGVMQFMDITRHLDGISPKSLSKDLKDLELNRLITRTVKDTMPITVEYELTEVGKTLHKVIDAMSDWGVHYRKVILKK